MDGIGYPDLHHARAAEGWLDLGDPVEAARELMALSTAARSHPDVLELCWRLHAARGDWESGLSVARMLMRRTPDRATAWIHQSYCLHELKRTPEAMEALLPAVDRFPGELIIPYNLACYACQMGDLETAKEWLARAAAGRDRGEIREMGLKDPDLEPLRGFLEGWGAGP